MNTGQEIIRPGKVVFLLAFPVYGIVARRDNWLKWAEKENPETVKDFLEDEIKLGMIPFFILGEYAYSGLAKDERGVFREQECVRRWASNNRACHMELVDSPENLLKHLLQFLNFQEDRYLKSVMAELKLYLKYTYNKNNPRFRYQYREMFELFDKALG